MSSLRNTFSLFIVAWALCGSQSLMAALFEPMEQISQSQATLLGASLTLAAGGPAQTHIGTGSGGSQSDMVWNGKQKRK